MVINKLLLFLLLLVNLNTFSQVTIGSGKKPNLGSLLDLKESDSVSTRGMMLPRVSLQKLDVLTMGDYVIENQGSAWQEHAGLIVYNMNKIETAANRLCPGVHVWDGTSWVSMVSYSNPLEQKIQKSMVRKFVYLDSDPSSDKFDITLWPEDKKADALAGKYILGHSATNQTDDLVDVRGTESNTYYVSRFYVGYKTEDVEYDLQKSYNCDPKATPVWVHDSNITQVNKYFSDGVWTTQNLRTTKFPDGTDIPTGATSSTLPYYASPPKNIPTYGRFYNWPAVINIGTGTGQTPDPGGAEQGGAQNKDVAIQGICPAGWHVPSMQELTDLYNGVSLNAPLVSTETIGGSQTLFAYTFTGINDVPYTQGPVWNALRASVMGGTSYAADGGGFYSLPAGRPGVNETSYYWTASSSSSTNAYGSYIVADRGVLREKLPRNLNVSVRCMRDTE